MVDFRKKPEHVVGWSAKKLGLKHEVQLAAQTIAKNFFELDVKSGSTPETIAGVSIFMAITNFGAQSKNAENVWLQISEVVDITVSTLKECYS